MIPVLWDKDEIEFGTKVMCRLGEATYCVVTEGINDIYECEMQYPVWGKYFELLEEGRFIGASHDDRQTDNVQPFEIYKRSAPLNGIVTFYAHHLSYKASRVIIKPISVTSPAGAFGQFRSACYNTNPFTFQASYAPAGGELELTEPTSLRSALMAKKDSVVSNFGGELEFDKWMITLHENRGTSTNATIMYGKNLTGLEQSIDAENLYNAIIPYWSGKIDGVDVLILPDEGDEIVTLSGVTNPKPIAKDFSSEFKQAPEAQDLIDKAEEFLTKEQPWIPKENIRINFVQLWQTEEYKNVSALQRVKLGDKVNVIYPALGVTAENFEVIKASYNVLEDKYDSMELGTVNVTFLEKIKQDYDEQIFNTQSTFEALMNAEIERATNLLKNPGSSHVLFYKGTMDQSGNITNLVTGNGTLQDPEGILIMDTNNTRTASQVLIINKSGIGFSSNGVNGPYTSSWTLDGRFTTDFIATWELLVNVIRLYGLMEVHENAAATTENGQLVDPIGGYIGFGYGRIDSTPSGVTKGIMLSNTDRNDGKNSRYLIATDSGIRMTAGDNSIYLTDNLVQGQVSGNAVIQAVNDLIFSIGDKIKVKDNNVVGATEYEGVTTGSSSDGYTLQIGPARLKFYKGICIGATAWSQSAYDALEQSIGSGGGGGGGSGGTAVFG